MQGSEQEQMTHMCCQLKYICTLGLFARLDM